MSILVVDTYYNIAMTTSVSLSNMDLTYFPVEITELTNLRSFYLWQVIS